MSERHVIILGAGVSGLSIAWRLLADPEVAGATPTARADLPLAESLPALRERLRVTVVDAGDRPGGFIRTERDRDFLLEWGPTGFLDNAPETPRLCRALGLGPNVRPASAAAANRFLYARGRLHKVPLSPPAFFTSSILSWLGRFRVAMEPFVPARPDPEESIHDFASRRIGGEAARTLVQAMISGVYGGDARQLAVGSALPRLHTLERDYGGLVRGMIGRMREAKRAGRNGGGPTGPGGVLTSFDEGMEVLVRGLVDRVRETGRFTWRGGRAVERVERRGEGGWRVILSGGEALAADAVVCALPAGRTAEVFRSLDADLASALEGVPTVPMVVLALAYQNADLSAPLDGFGLLIPRGEGPRSLGVLWDSSIFPGRAPDSMALLRVMIGGAHDPEAVDLGDGALLEIAKKDISTTMKVTADPRIVWIRRHPRAIPQYVRGHADRVARLERAEAACPGLFFEGNSWRGIAVNSCVERSIPAARNVLHFLRR